MHFYNYSTTKQSACRGYTLIELMLSLSFLVVLAVIAIPALGSSVDRHKLRAASSTFQTSLALARNHALTKAAYVVICPKTDKDQCKPKTVRNQRWENGWLIFVDSNVNRILDSNELVINQGKIDKSNSLIFNQNGVIRFFPSGRARSAGFIVCSEQLDSKGRHLKLLHTGRVRASEVSSGKQLSNCQNSF